MALGFNPQPRVAADPAMAKLAERISVSIHSRAWRLTLSRYRSRNGIIRFNPQPRVAADVITSFNPITFNVSIHSRAWRLTKNNHFKSGFVRSFNPQPRVAADLLLSLWCAVSDLFQSTAARGG